MRKVINVKLTIEGMHNWPEASEVFPQMSFLSYPHRHLFYIEAEKSVEGWNRDIEIIDFKRKIYNYLLSFFDEELNMCNFNNYSCEKLAELILIEFDCDKVKVTEDDENGATVYKN